ncbi:hypothetical protein FHS89_000519 [Rubricella aquisinus]|uniref:Uncharacterized protein n=1 Tax=Rubricella aquisinus TaxID=2028108 RepID=A0A840WJ32_9RHOB|nr:hypothetical protein [Rubricella aquisinus]MBB5514521.1 hypothetical protein [Rubricella aquisinus]
MGSVSFTIDARNSGGVEVSFRSNTSSGTLYFDGMASPGNPANYTNNELPSGPYAFQIRNQDGFQNISTHVSPNSLTVDGKPVEFQFVTHAEDEDHFDQMVLYFDL